MDVMERVQSSLYQIKNKIKANSEIRKLIYYTEANALSKSEVSYSTVDELVTLKPIFNMNAGGFNRNSFISIAVTNVESSGDEGMFKGILRINVICKNSTWELEENRIRPLKIIGILKGILDNEKFDVSHKLYFLNMQTIVIDEDNSGYMVLFRIAEGAGLINDY